MVEGDESLRLRHQFDVLLSSYLRSMSESAVVPSRDPVVNRVFDSWSQSSTKR
jgi:hypothetical protein